jgi:hypothetical protein
MAKQYRKKPVVIEAMQLNWSKWNEICDFVPRPWFEEGVYLDEKGEVMQSGSSEKMGLLLNTLESNKKTGSLLATEGDWIIKGVNGEFYPCKPDVFEKTYDAVE